MNCNRQKENDKPLLSIGMERYAVIERAGKGKKICRRIAKDTDWETFYNVDYLRLK